MTFSVTVLTSEAGRTSGYLLGHHGRTILIDCGPSVTDRLQHQIALEDLCAVVVTHAHADHCLDLVGLAYALRFPEPRSTLVPLWVPEEMTGLLGKLDAHFGVPTLPTMTSPLRQSFHIRSLSLTGTHRAEILPGIELTARPARHAVPSAALRFSDGTRTVAFSSDTGLTATLIDTAATADLFFCEATYLTATPAELDGHGHLTASQAGQIASHADTRHLVLTHLSRPHDGPHALEEAARSYPGKLNVAVRGARYLIPSRGAWAAPTRPDKPLHHARQGTRKCAPWSGTALSRPH